MSYKMTCPGCESHTSDVARSFEDDRPCPNCGLPAQSAFAVMAIRESRANESVRKRAEEAETRAGRAEDELTRLRIFTEDVRELLQRLDG